MTDISVTVSSVICLAKLVERVQRSGDPDARELAARVSQAIERPDRRVGAALQPRKRGGVAKDLAQRLEQRNADLCALATLMGNTPDLAEEMARQLARYRPVPEETNPKRRLMQKIVSAGRPIKKRQIKKILTLQKASLKGQESP